MVTGRMRAPRTEAPGTAGQSFVKGHFEAMGWGVMPNPEHDLGTDMVVQARDELGDDLGLLIGVQVKTGASYFSEPVEENDEPVAWWFREDEAHFNYWLGYQTAHIVVLHDLDTGIAYWGHVTADAVVSTGKGRKMLIRSTQTVDRNHHQALITVAASKVHLPKGDGTPWNIYRGVPIASRLRYALMIPRLLLPPPNTDPSDVTAAQGIALFTSQRLREMDRLTGHQTPPESEQSPSDEEWTWLLFEALREWWKTGDQTGLANLVIAAAHPEQHAAVAVCLGHAMFEDGHPADALKVIESALTVEGLTPSDLCWLTAHKARFSYEAGDLETARTLAQEVRSANDSLLSDPTVRALVGPASDLLFALGEWSDETLADSARGRDTVASNLRNKALLQGLDNQVEEVFKAWSPDGSITFGAMDRPWFQYRAFMLQSGYAADSQSWRYGANLLARRVLVEGRTPVPDYVFELLVLSGATKDVRRVASRFRSRGPASPLVVNASKVDLSDCTRSSLEASIALVEMAGDLLPPEISDKHAAFALEALAGTSETVQRLRPKFFVGESLLKMLASLWFGLSPSATRDVMNHILRLPAITDQLVAGGYAHLLRRIPNEVWTDEELRQLADRPAGDEGDNFELTRAIERLRASRSPEYRASLLERIANGDLDALSSYGNVTELPASVAGQAIVAIAGRVEAQTESARKGTYGFGGHDVLHALILLDTWHPAVADWATVCGALTEPKMSEEHLVESLKLLATLAAHIEEPVRLTLRRPLENVRDRTEFPRAFAASSDGTAITGLARVALASLFPGSIDTKSLVTLVQGDPGDRAAVASILAARGKESSLLTLAALSKDEDCSVRAAAARGLARWVVNGTARDESLALLRALLAESGIALGFAVAEALPIDECGDGLHHLAELLADHPSATVRAHAARTLPAGKG